ncbi:MAG TPA: hypothetical protein VNA12_08645 [Mycobacteriales bacterium]|nr:hypothetical protein [Mycobacteriales bacterium]
MATTDAPLRPRSRTDTTPSWDGIDSVRRARMSRRILLSLFAAFLALGATGVLGVRTGRVSAEGGGYRLHVEYPKVTRPGHAVPLAVEVHKPGGFGDEPVVIAMRAGYFALFDENGVLPGPSAETADRRDVMWEFDPPPGDVLRVRFDTRTGPNRQLGERGTAAVLVDDEPVVRVAFRTWVMP